MSSESMFMGIGVLVVLYLIYDALSKREARRPPQRPPQPGAGNPGQYQQQPPQNPVNYKGNFDAESFNKAQAIMGALNNYPDDLSKSMALADYLHREKSREKHQVERRREPAMNSDALFDGFTRLFDRITGPSRRTERPYDDDYMDRGHDYPPQRRTRRIDGYPPSHQDEYPLRDRNGRWK